jgi:sulfatase maturation enzyme AslB (radical SAM superfamily)
VLDPFITLDEITLEQFKEWFPIDFVQQLNDLNMCGNLGDPIIAKDTLEIFQYLRNTNPNIILSMHTNGSARTLAWWRELAGLQVRVTFGIDGLSDTHALYRIGTDFNQILKNAQEFITAGGEAEWHMLLFKHNEHQVDQCRSISETYGFKRFSAKNTSRFRDGKFNDKDPEPSKKEFAEFAMKQEEILRPILFSMWDKNYSKVDEIIWKSVKPKYSKPFKNEQ